MKTLIENFSKQSLDEFISQVRPIINEGIDENKRIIFLCGADKSDKSSLRYAFSQILESQKNIELAYPEDLFEDLLEGQGSNSLLSLENHLADAVDLIALIPESPGSFAELGAFSAQKSLAKKTIVFRLSKYKSDRSFINHGPIRLVKKYKGKVYDIPNDFSLSRKDETEKITEFFKRELGSRRKKKVADNFLSYPHQILLLVYLFDGLTFRKIKALLEMVFERKFKTEDDLAIKAAIHSIVKRRLVEENESKFTISESGFQYINKKYFMMSKITELRVKAMNFQLVRR